MDATLVLASLSQAYSDTPSTSTPIMKSVDWQNQVSVQVSNAKTSLFSVAPGATLSVFSGVRTTSIDGTTQLTLALSILDSARYRFTATAGTSPVFRTDRALALSTHAVTITANANQTATIGANAGAFSAVQVGDTVFIPGPTTGDVATVFSSLNEGLWVVIAQTSTTLQVTRLAGVPFSAATETQTPASNGQLIAFSAAGVQVGDQVTISAGFSASVLKSYSIVAVTSTWFEVVSTAALPISAVAIPTASGIQFYSSAKRYLRILADQECIPQLNGDSGTSNRMSPWAPGDSTQMADYVKVGPSWSLSIQNVSQATMNLVVISAE